jgi:hypothetical protein
MTIDDRDLQSLPRRDVEPEVSARIRGAARAAFEEEHELRAQPAAFAALHRASRVVFPAAVAGAVVVYLAWAVQAANALYP